MSSLAFQFVAAAYGSLGRGACVARGRGVGHTPLLFQGLQK